MPPYRLAARSVCVAALAGSALLSGCATTDSAMTTVMGTGTSVTATDASRLTQSGFLSDYARLRPTPWGDGIQCWREQGLNAARYDKIMISRILVSVKSKDGESAAIDPSDLKTLTDYFHTSLTRALSPQMQVVDKPGPGVLVLRIALTRLVPTGVTESLAGTLVPYAFIAEAGSGVATGRPAGRRPTWARRAWKCNSAMARRAQSSASAATRRSAASTRRTSTPAPSARRRRGQAAT